MNFGAHFQRDLHILHGCWWPAMRARVDWQKFAKSSSTSLFSGFPQMGDPHFIIHETMGIPIINHPFWGIFGAPNLWKPQNNHHSIYSKGMTWWANSIYSLPHFNAACVKKMPLLPIFVTRASERAWYFSLEFLTCIWRSWLVHLCLGCFFLPLVLVLSSHLKSTKSEVVVWCSVAWFSRKSWMKNRTVLQKWCRIDSVTLQFTKYKWPRDYCWEIKNRLKILFAKSYGNHQGSWILGKLQ